jgi:hypothetical protein
LLRTLYSLRESPRAQNSLDQGSKSSSSCDTCTVRQMIKFLGSATLRLYVRLLSGDVRYCTTTFYYFQKDIHETALLSFFLHQLTINYFKQLNISTVENGTAGTSGTDPASGYNLKLSRLFVMFVLFLYRLSANTNNIYAFIILLILNNSMIFLLDFGIKIYHKMPKPLTTSKLNEFFFLPCFSTIH